MPDDVEHYFNSCIFHLDQITNNIHLAGLLRLNVINLLSLRFIMALRVGSDWLQFFLDANIPAEESKEYAKIFVGNRMTEELLSEITMDTLRELGITSPW